MTAASHDKDAENDEDLVTVTMEVEPAQLAIIDSIASATGVSRSDVLREAISLGLDLATRGH